ARLEARRRPLRPARAPGGRVHRAPQHRGRPAGEPLHLGSTDRPADPEIPPRRPAALERAAPRYSVFRLTQLSVLSTVRSTAFPARLPVRSAHLPVRLTVRSTPS